MINPAQSFLEKTLPIFQAAPRILGLAAFSRAESGEFSDLDLAVVCDAAGQRALLAERRELTRRLGSDCLAGPLDESEPRLFLSLYDSPGLCVDLRFLALEDFPAAGTQPDLLWDRADALKKKLEESSTAAPVTPDLQRIEDHFWLWLLYGAQRLGRGELFETLHLLSRLRARALAPLLLWKQGHPAARQRDLERHGDEESLRHLRATVPIYDAHSCRLSLMEAARLYIDLRENLADLSLQRRRRLEMAAMRCLHQGNEENQAQEDKDSLSR